jgi:hypothetical protein
VTPGLFDHVKAAFNARPLGMPVPPNWIGLAAVALLGVLNPGIWLVGAGLEIGYLMWLAHHPRFRAVLRGRQLAEAGKEWSDRVAQHIAGLSDADLGRYRALEARCQGIIAQQTGSSDPGGLTAQSEGLSRLLWIYLRLLGTRQAISRIGDEDDLANRTRLEDKARALAKQLEDTALGDDLRQSLSGQLDIVKQRLSKRKEAAQKLAFLAAEIQRIEEQVELIREQATLASNPESVSQRIDEVAATLGGTHDWIREQQQLYGQVEDLIVSPPPLISADPAARPNAKARAKQPLKQEP